MRFECLVNYEINRTPVGEGSALKRDTARSDRINLLFEAGVYARFCPSFSDREVVQVEIFDWSEVRGRQQLGETISAWKERFLSEWLDTSICPNPRMYEVQSSLWLAEVWPDVANFKHFLLLGHDVYVEVIAQGWRWESAAVKDHKK